MNTDFQHLVERKLGLDFSREPLRSKRQIILTGLQVDFEGIAISKIYVDMGWGKTTTYYYYSRWRELLREGDVDVTTIAKRYSELIGKPMITDDAKTEPLKLNPIKVVTLMKRKSEHHSNVSLGFRFTEDEQQRIDAAIRASIVFMGRYGSGAQPRTKGEYYEPGTNPAEHTEEGIWLCQEQAALYCGCSEQELIDLYNNGVVDRRIYKRVPSRAYYEYYVPDIDYYLRETGHKG